MKKQLLGLMLFFCIGITEIVGARRPFSLSRAESTALSILILSLIVRVACEDPLAPPARLRGSVLTAISADGTIELTEEVVVAIDAALATPTPTPSSLQPAPDSTEFGRCSAHLTPKPRARPQPTDRYAEALERARRIKQPRKAKHDSTRFSNSTPKPSN